MNIEQIIARQENNFKSKFPKLIKKSLNWNMESDPTEEILNWHSSSIKEILEGVVEFQKAKLSKQKIDNGHDCYGSNCDYCENAIKDEILSDTINYLSEIIKKL